MKTELVPVILPEHEPIVIWVQRKIQLSHFWDGHHAITTLDCKEPEQREKDDEKYVDMWNLYNSLSTEYKQNINNAILKRAYKKTTDIKEGEIITNGDVVGFACYFNWDWNKRTFRLSSSRSLKSEWYPTHKIDDFYRVVQH
ncbi:hypothetical protein [Bacillus thuringiensis]|uniref:Uncharacterized protein n=1 Tax=Bacillus thuringiensis TaxID=1428 RepID=A0A9X6ZQN4_BACTU|nr:hypothetical protein [Bacillus thuringiensis]PFJ32307.1 hypothetical protein COJ15_28980 [Bacillus thuringiensis]